MFKVLMVSLFITLPAFASDVSQLQVPLENGASFQSVRLNDWEFLGCFQTRRECRHEARHEGYHHVRAIHDHHTCGSHHPYACYAQD